MIFAIFFFAIVIPFVAPYRLKKIALYISLMLLFIPWGLQYEMTQDWVPHLLHWDVINNGKSEAFESRNIEPIYALWLKICSPLSYFGYLMICAMIELGIIAYLLIRFVNPRYYWASLVVLLLCVENGLLMINSNRQSMALMITIIASLYLFGKQTNMEDLNLKKIVVFLITIIIARYVHGGAVVALMLLPLAYISMKVKKMNNLFWILAMNIFFVSRFFIDASWIQMLGIIYLGGSGLDNFEQYLLEIETAERISRVFTPIFFVLMNLILLTYHRMPTIIRFFAIALLIKIQFHSFLTGNISRILQYFYIYSIVVVPYTIMLTKNTNVILLKIIRITFCISSLMLLIYEFSKNIYTEYCYERWLDFKTIFDAPYWL